MSETMLDQSDFGVPDAIIANRCNESGRLQLCPLCNEPVKMVVWLEDCGCAWYTIHCPLPSCIMGDLHEQKRIGPRFSTCYAAFEWWNARTAEELTELMEQRKNWEKSE